MADLRRTIAGQHNLLERLARRVPGFRGYREAEARREADHLLRCFGVAELERIAARLHDHKRAAALEELRPLEDVLTRVETLRNELRYAERGYSGFFDEIKWDRPELLDRLYAGDERVLEAIEALALAVEAERDPERWLAAVSTLRRSVEERQRSLLRAGGSER